MRAKMMLCGLVALGAALLPVAGLAQGLEIIGAPKPEGIGFQEAATSIAVQQQWLDGMLNWIIGAIVAFVTLLLAFVILRYNRRANPTPKSFTHNSPIEVAWTVIPIIILVFIGFFSLPILFNQQEMPEGEVVIKVTGNQWYWNYEYVGQDVAFDSYMIGGLNLGGDARMTPAVEAELKAAGYAKEHFLLATDTAVVIPVGKVILMQVTGADVIHSWKIPAFGVMQDAVPGRLASLWFKADKEGVYFGQCSELCGKDHAYMPITVKVVSEAVYAAWLAQAQAGDVILSDATVSSATQVAANN